MGDKITREAKSADLLRAKMLKEALWRGTPTLSQTSSAQAEFDANNLEIQKAYLEQLVECAPEAITILDHYTVLRINSEFTTVFGFSAEEATGRRIDDLIVPPDRAAETKWIGERLAQGEKVLLETKRQRKDGSVVDVIISSAPVVVGGKQVGVYAIYRDITDQKRAEKLNSALYRIAEKANSAVDLQSLYAGIHNIVGELMYASNFYIALLDPVTQLLSFPYFVDEEDPPPSPRRLRRGLTEYVLRKGEPLLVTNESFETLVATGDVELIGAPSLDWMGIPLKAAGNTFGVLVVQSYTDHVRYGEKDKEILTFVSQQVGSAIEHKRSEEALRHSEWRYRSLVHSAVHGIYRSSMEGKFLDVNPALVMMLGYNSADELLALDPKKDIFIDAGEQQRVITAFQRAAQLEGVEVRWRRKDGGPITVRLSGRAVSSGTEAEQVLEIIAEDVTEQRILENQFRQAQKMEAVGRLAGGVAHDFNNLLMVISGYTEVLLENIERNNPLCSKIQAIQQAADRASGLTRQLLAFSRKQLLELKVIDLNAVISDMQRLLRPLIGEDIELLTRLAPDLAHTRADAGQIEQVIMNLVVNSKDAMPDGGKIVIETKNANFEDDSRRDYTHIRPGQYVVLSITDTGQGMDKETQSRLFEPFFTTKEKGKGTGLGLSTVYGIVKQSGGYVFAQSEVGHGTTFRIYLPRVEQDLEPLSDSPQKDVRLRGSETVLLVEDEESVRQLVRETLEARGYTVLEAENGESALAVAASQQRHIHMLITDVVMPGMGGRELAEKLCAAHPHTKVLYLSGYTEDTVVQDASSPETAFLQKPFTLQMLLRKVREALRAEPA